MVVLRTRDFRAAETAGDASLDTACAEAHGALHTLLHGAAERDAFLELLGDVLRHKLRRDVRALHLDDVERDGFLDHGFDFGAQLFNVGAAATDDHTGTSAVQENPHPRAVAFNFNARNARGIERVL